MYIGALQMTMMMMMMMTYVNYQLARLSAYRSDHLHDHKAKKNKPRSADCTSLAAHPRHLTNRNRATSIEWKWTWHTSHLKWCP